MMSINKKVPTTTNWIKGTSLSELSESELNNKRGVVIAYFGGDTYGTGTYMHTAIIVSYNSNTKKLKILDSNWEFDKLVKMHNLNKTGKHLNAWENYNIVE